MLRARLFEKAMSRGNKARRDAFISIPAETKQLLRHLIPAIQHMPKIDRIDGVGAEMKRAAWGILREYHMAYRCQESRTSFKATQEIRRRICEKWWEFLDWDSRRQCVVCKPGWS